MKCVLDVTALHYLCVKIPKYKDEPLVQRNTIKVFDKKFVNKCCGKFYTELGSLFVHQAIIHQSDKRLSSEEVEETDEDYFKAARNNVTPESQTPKNQFEKFLLNKREKKEKLKTKLECTFCGKLLSNESAKKVHERTQHKEGGHTCKYCGKYFRIRVNGMTHENRMHKTEENLLKPFKCSICLQGFTKVRRILVIIFRSKLNVNFSFLGVQLRSTHETARVWHV